jgi:hypothetical protein
LLIFRSDVAAFPQGVFLVFITVTKQEVAELNAVCRTEFEDVLKTFGAEVQDRELQEISLQGVTVVDQGDRWVIEINPEIAQRQAKALGRFARVAAPLVFALKAAFSELFKEFEGIQRWISAKR